MKAGNPNRDSSHSSLSLFLLLGMHGWIDILAKRDGLGALHGWGGKGLKIACEGVCYFECLGGNLIVYTYC
jgi:hypothetical protein